MLFAAPSIFATAALLSFSAARTVARNKGMGRKGQGIEQTEASGQGPGSQKIQPLPGLMLAGWGAVAACRHGFCSENLHVYNI